MYTRLLYFGLGAVVALAALVYLVLSSMISQHRSFEAQVRQWVLERTSMTQIDEIDEYRGATSYAVAIGKNGVGTPVIAWMTKDSLIFDEMEGAVSKESVRQAVQQGFPDATILHIVPGVEGGQRFWEATFVDGQGRYHYVHYDFTTGKVIKSYQVNPPGA